MEKKATKVGIIGCGNISGAYLKALKSFDVLEVVACADIKRGRAKARAKEFHVPRVHSVKRLLSDRHIQIVVNLTPPTAHAEVGMAILEAGKCLYNEKPLANKRRDGKKMLKTAKKRNLLIGCAPDTFLGGGLQTCRKLIDDGHIGRPVAASAFMMSHGHENWHPDPEFYYQPGGGPMFDMGPYYLTALITLLGPVRQVSGLARITFRERTITSKPKYGKIIKVRTPTHVAGIIDFINGPIVTMITSYDIWASSLPYIEIYGTEGSLSVPDPNRFGGPVRLRRASANDWEEVTLTHGYTENSRGIGVADMAYAMRSGRPHRANGEMGYHVLDIMHAFHDASRAGEHIEVNSTCERPASLPPRSGEKGLIE